MLKKACLFLMAVGGMLALPNASAAITTYDSGTNALTWDLSSLTDSLMGGFGQAIAVAVVLFVAFLVWRIIKSVVRGR